MTERSKLEVMKRTSYDGRRWEKGEIMEVGVDETEEYPLKGMIKSGIVEKVNDRVNDRVEREVPSSNEMKGCSLSTEMLEKVEGVGPSYAEKIKDEYGTVERLLEESPGKIAGSVHGITPELAERILKKIKIR